MTVNIQNDSHLTIKSSGVFILCIALFLLTLSHSSLADNAWYRGQVSRIALIGGIGFVLMMDNGVLDDCEDKYVILL